MSPAIRYQNGAAILLVFSAGKRLQIGHAPQARYALHLRADAGLPPAGAQLQSPVFMGDAALVHMMMDVPWQTQAAKPQAQWQERGAGAAAMG